tara:strand:+ start:300 stop:923 length:624 start_codon:yes stop_codon:yes gene_type:complete
MKVILIGNSSIDETRELGFKIDNDFDLVVRMNRYQIEGFENYIGSKTHIWALNRTISLGHSRVHYNGPDTDLRSEFKKRQTMNVELEKMILLTYTESSDTINNLKHKTSKYSNFEVANTTSLSSHLFEQWKKHMKVPFYKPPTGLITIHYLLERHEKIYIHNFDNGKSSHYWEEIDPISQPQASKHNWSFDEIVINDLVEQGKVIYL